MKPQASVLEPRLVKRLEADGIRVAIPDDHTVFLDRVRVSADHFNERETRVLITRAQRLGAFLILVPDTLDYTGDDPRVARAFELASPKDEWKALHLRPDRTASAAEAVERALAALGHTGDEPRIPGTEGVLAEHGRELPAGGAPALWRGEAVERALAVLRQWRPRMPVILGESGAGKSNLLDEIARRLAAGTPARRTVAINLARAMSGCLFEADRENVLLSILDEAAAAEGRTLVVLEDAEWAFLNLPRAPQMVADAVEHGALLAGASLPSFAGLFAHSAAVQRMVVIRLEELSARGAADAVEAVIGEVAAHHGIEIEKPLAAAAVEISQTISGALPAKAIHLLDMAASWAALRGEAKLSADHLHLTASGLSAAGQ